MGTTGTIVALAECAELGGAVGLRIDGAPNTAAVKAAVPLPIIAINKVVTNGAPLITPDLAIIPVLINAGASVVAIELTRRAYPGDTEYQKAPCRNAGERRSRSGTSSGRLRFPRQETRLYGFWIYSAGGSRLRTASPRLGSPPLGKYRRKET
jgi:hypothetical protein